jgi:small subunit ribosomal protein S18
MRIAPIMEKIESNRNEKLNDHDMRPKVSQDPLRAVTGAPQGAGIRNDSSSLAVQYGTTGRPGRVEIDYKNTTLLFRYLTEQGKIIPRRLSGLTAKQQRHMTKAIKQARILGLIRFTNNK